MPFNHISTEIQESYFKISGPPRMSSGSYMYNLKLDFKYSFKYFKYSSIQVFNYSSIGCERGSRKVRVQGEGVEGRGLVAR